MEYRISLTSLFICQLSRFLALILPSIGRSMANVTLLTFVARLCSIHTVQLTGSYFKVFEIYKAKSRAAPSEEANQIPLSFFRLPWTAR